MVSAASCDASQHPVTPPAPIVPRNTPKHGGGAASKLYWAVLRDPGAPLQPDMLLAVLQGLQEVEVSAGGAGEGSPPCLRVPTHLAAPRSLEARAPEGGAQDTRAQGERQCRDTDTFGGLWGGHRDEGSPKGGGRTSRTPKHSVPRVVLCGLWHCPLDGWWLLLGASLCPQGRWDCDAPGCVPNDCDTQDMSPWGYAGICVLDMAPGDCGIQGCVLGAVTLPVLCNPGTPCHFLGTIPPAILSVSPSCSSHSPSPPH